MGLICSLSCQLLKAVSEADTGVWGWETPKVLSLVF
jgi:hypothetical protein